MNPFVQDTSQLTLEAPPNKLASQSNDASNQSTKENLDYLFHRIQYLKFEELHIKNNMDHMAQDIWA